MNMMDISREAHKIANEIKANKDAGEGLAVKATHVIRLAVLVSELASESSSATDPRLYGGS